MNMLRINIDFCHKSMYAQQTQNNIAHSKISEVACGNGLAFFSLWYTEATERSLMGLNPPPHVALQNFSVLPSSSLATQFTLIFLVTST
jgi:hypothetical protein